MRLHLAPVSLTLLAGSVASQGFNEPPIAFDKNPDPNIVEVDLEASETTWQYIDGVDTTVWAYNGTVPGPTIVAKVGDTIRVNFTNNLPEETTIHWHGIEAPAFMDGSHVSQALIQPGESFTYEFPAVTEDSDSFNWYHPHVRPFDQVEKGLYGGIIIRNLAREQTLGFDTIEEHVMFFDDVLLDGSSQVVPAFSFTDPLLNAAYQLNGREGNVLLINGKEAEFASLTVPNGEPQRWRIVNAANTTFCRLDLRDPDEGLDESIWMVGTDGGFINTPFELLDVTVVSANSDHPNQTLIANMGEGVYLTPGERIDIIFTPIGNDGEAFQIYNADWFRGRHSPTYGTAGQILLPDDPNDGLYPPQKWLELVVEGPDPGNGEHVLPAVLRNFPPLNRNISSYDVLPMVYGHSLPDASGNVTLFVQAEFDPQGMIIPYPAPKVTSLIANDAEVGDEMMWEITNLTHGDHNFHTHGFSFELLEYEFIDMADPSNNSVFRPSLKRMHKDVLRVPPRLGPKGMSKTITRVKVHFSEAGREGQVEAGGELPVFGPMGQFSSGGWLVHCHILEHSGKGMLSFFEVRDPNQTFHALGSFLQGTTGPTYLSVEGSLTPGDPVDLHIMNALPNTNIFIVVGNIEANRPFRGGNIVPGYTANGTTVANNPRYIKTYSLTTDGSGNGTLSTLDWERAFPGTTLYWQAAQRDAGTAAGWALSNAVSFKVP